MTASTKPDATANARRTFFATAAALAVAGLAGCVVVPYGHGRYRSGGVDRDRDGAPDYGPVVEAGPPPQQVEMVPASPGAAYIWIGGYWAWQLGRHVWIGGRWGQPPRRGYAWVPGAWGRHGPGWRWRGGYWGRG